MKKVTKKPEKVLIIEDEEDTRKMFRLGLSGYGYEVDVAPDGKTAKDLLQSKKYTVVVADLRLPDVKGMELIGFIKTVSPLSRVVVMTAHASLEVAKDCVEKGATSFLVKPFGLEQMHYTIETAIAERRLMAEEETSYEDMLSENIFSDMVGKSLEMKKIYHTILTVAKTSSPVVILGETGTGKELVALAIHAHSKRSRNTMVAVNCASLSENLLESELFGHVKGAFTGAIKDKPGLLEMASNSTLFLDEITEVSRAIQAKLLRFLENGEFRQVGGTVNRRSNARILTSSNRNLEEEVRGGGLREDLFHRLNVISICLPPLRERREDIPLLSHHFLRIHVAKLKKPIKTISPSALSLLMAQQWPGNVRELQNTIERAVTFCTGDAILPYHFYPSMRVHPDDEDKNFFLDLNKTVQAVEKAQIIKALRISGGNKTRAAKILGIDRITLWRKMKAAGLQE